MNRKTLAASALVAAAALCTGPPAAHADTAATRAARLAGSVLEAVIGGGVGVGMTELLGGGPSPVGLSEEAFDRIGTIVNDAVNNGRFADHEIDATQAVDAASDYYRPANATEAYDTAKGIARRAGDVGVAMKTFALRGVPAYGLMTALEARFTEEAAVARGLQGDAYGRDAELAVRRGVGLDGLVHLDAMQDLWQVAQVGKYPLYQHQTRVVRVFLPARQHLYQRACFDGPSGRVCSDREWDCSVSSGEATVNDTVSENHQCEDSRDQWADAWGKRSQQLAREHAEIFGADPTLRVRLGGIAEIADRFDDWRSEVGHFVYDQGYRIGTHPRMLGDVDGDGNADVVAISNDGVELTFADGNGGFGPVVSSIRSFAPSGGWTAEHPRFVADMNDDGYADLIGMSGNGVWVAYSNGATFGTPVRVIDGFGTDHGWRTDRHVRAVADVNGDGRADIIGINDDDVFVALNSAIGFAAQRSWSREFTLNSSGWDVARHPRQLADVNGDGMADLVGFGGEGVYVSLSNGGAFEPSALWSQRFHYTHGWRVGVHERHLADINGDGLADIVGFGGTGTWVGLSTGAGFVDDGSPTGSWHPSYGSDQDWHAGYFPRVLGDINGDGAADIVGFHRAVTAVSVAVAP